MEAGRGTDRAALVELKLAVINEADVGMWPPSALWSGPLPLHARAASPVHRAELHVDRPRGLPKATSPGKAWGKRGQMLSVGTWCFPPRRVANVIP